MTSLKLKYWNVLSLSLAILLTTGCGTTPPSRYYMLNSIPQAASEDSHDRSNKNAVQIGIGPVTFPKYLDRYSIVIRSEGAEVVINDLQQWAEPLADNFTHVMSDNLYQLIDGAETSIYPWQNQSNVDYQVVIDVLRFDADVSNTVVLNTRWTIYNASGKQALFHKNSMLKEQAANQEYETLVSAQSKVLEYLSREIAAKLKEIIARSN